MKKLVMSLVLFSGYCHAQVPGPVAALPSIPVNNLPLVQSYSSGVPVLGPSSLVDNGISLLYKGSPIGGVAGVSGINGLGGAFTFSGSGVICVGVACTFTGGSSPVYTGISTQSGATYTVTNTDCTQSGTEIQFTSTTGTAITLPVTGVTTGCIVRFKNLVSGKTLVVTPAAGTIDQAASLTISYPGDGDFYFTGNTTGITWLGFGGYGVRGASALLTQYALPYVSNIGTLSQASFSGIPKISTTGPPTAAVSGTDFLAPTALLNGTDTGTANTYVVSTPTATVAGSLVQFTPLNSNSQQSTISVNSATVVDLKSTSGLSLEGGALQAGVSYTLYTPDNIKWQLLNPNTHFTDFTHQRYMSTAPPVAMAEQSLGVGPYNTGSTTGLNRYIDCGIGSDTNNGLSVLFPWKTLEHVSQYPSIVGPGTQILINGATTCHGELLMGNNVTATGTTTNITNPPAFSGSSSFPVVISSYGGTATIDGADLISTTWSLISGSTTSYQATLPSVAATNVTYNSGSGGYLQVTMSTVQTYLLNTQVSLVGCANTDFNQEGYILATGSGGILPSNIFNIAGITAPAEGSSSGCGVVFAPAKLYADFGDSSHPALPLQTPPLTIEHNYAGTWGTGIKYHMFDSVLSGSTYYMYYEEGQGTNSVVTSDPVAIPANQALVNDSNTGVQNVVANPGSWYFSGGTIYVHLTGGDSPSLHTIEATHRISGVLLLGLNNVTVDGIAVERTQGPAIASGVFSNSTLAGLYSTGNNITVQNSTVVNYDSIGGPNIYQQGGVGTKLFGGGSAGIEGGIIIAGYQASCFCSLQIQNPIIKNNSVGEFDDQFQFSSPQKAGIGMFGFNGGQIIGNYVDTINDTGIAANPSANSPGNTNLLLEYNIVTDSNVNMSMASTQNATVAYNTVFRSSGEGLQTGGIIVAPVSNAYPSGATWCDTNINAHHNSFSYLAASIFTGEGFNGFDTAGGVSGVIANNTLKHIAGNSITLEYLTSSTPNATSCPNTPNGGDHVRVSSNIADQSDTTSAGLVLFRYEANLDGSTFDHNDWLAANNTLSSAMYVNLGLGSTNGQNNTVAQFIASYDTTGYNVMPNFKAPSALDFTPEVGSGIAGLAASITGVLNPTLDLGAIPVPVAQPLARSHPFTVQANMPAGTCNFAEAVMLNNGRLISCNQGSWFDWVAYALKNSSGGGGSASINIQGTTNQVSVSGGSSTTPTLSLSTNIITPGSIGAGPLGVATPSLNYNSNSLSVIGMYESASLNQVNDLFSFTNVMGTGSSPTATLTLSHTGSSGAQTISLPFPLSTTTLSATTITGTSTGISTLGTATSGANFGSGNFTQTGSYWNGTVAIPLSFSCAFQLGTGTTPTETENCTFPSSVTTGIFQVPTLTTTTSGSNIHGFTLSGQELFISGAYLGPASASAATSIVRNSADVYNALLVANQNASSTAAALSVTNANSAYPAISTADIAAGTLYSAAGTALPTCSVTLKGDRRAVSDATSPTYMGAYTSGGAITAEVICSYNGTTYSWLTH